MLRLTNFGINTCKNSNGEWHVINNKVKVEIEDVAISKSLWLLEIGYFEYSTCKKALLCCHEKNH